VYNAVQLKPRAALGALGDTVKPASFILGAIPGVGAPLAMGVGALGGAMQKMDDEGQRGIGDFLSGAAQGASVGGAGALAGNIGQAGYNAIRGGVGGMGAGTNIPISMPTAPTQSMAGILESNMPSIGTRASMLPSVASSVKPGFAIGDTVRGAMSPVEGRSLGTFLANETATPDRSFLGEVGQMFKKNPELGLYAGSTLADMYGAGIQGGLVERQIANEEEYRRERLRQERLNMLLQAMAGMQQRGY